MHINPRFEVVALSNGRFAVIDTVNNESVRFNFSNPPLYGKEEWKNWHCANGFAARLGRKCLADA